ncbi:MAG: hypothetical protein DRJ42_28160 [Deltaproteobacteria bacterium]|nr:MAG: hypothetical protein DRJ42_28160 [Deltaproteobacteria bacterium]
MRQFLIGIALGTALFLVPAATTHAQDHGGDHGESAENHDSLGTRVVNVVGTTEFKGALFNFLLLIAILVYGGNKVLPGFLAGRKKEIQDGLEEAALMKEAAEAKFEEYSSRLEKLDQELDQIRKDMAKAGAKERDRIVAEAESKAARLRKDTEFIIDQQMKMIRDELTHVAVAAAIASAREVLSKETSTADQERLASSYLDRLKHRIDDGIDVQGGA